tara:strand:+ start:921 stop:1883 length:963 start_codon:yes stop_codon:yes gene_type:complete
MSLKTKKIFICGHNGMVGNSLLKLLKSKKFKSIIVKNRKDLDLTDFNKLNKFIRKTKPHIIINCAGLVGGIMANNLNPLNFLRVNINIQLNIINSCEKNKIKNFINLGSSCIYPKFSKQPIKEDYLLDGKLEKTNEGYALAKIIGLKACEYFNKKNKTNYVTLMPCNIYGPNDEFDKDKSHFLPALIRKFHKSKKNNSVEIWGSGNVKRELMHVDDLSDAIYFFMKKIYLKDKKLIKMINQKPYINIGSGKDMKIKDYTKIIKKIINKNAKVFYNKKYPDGTPRKLLDISKIKSFGWKPRIKLIDGINETYIWAIKNKVI